MASEVRRPASTILLAIIISFLGWGFAYGGVRVLRKWDSISFDYALHGLIGIAAGATMTAAGIWAVVSRRRHPMPLLIASRAAVVAGAAHVFGLVTYVIPCSGPS